MDVGEQRSAGWLRAGNISIDLEGFRILVGDRLVSLTYQEFELLQAFVSRLNQVIPYDDLARAIWGSIGQRSRRRLGVLLCRLRSKLDESRPYRFETVRGRGYGLMAPLDAAGAGS